LYVGNVFALQVSFHLSETNLNEMNRRHFSNHTIYTAVQTTKNADENSGLLPALASRNSGLLPSKASRKLSLQQQAVV
jgi:hypothetical protein